MMLVSHSLISHTSLQGCYCKRAGNVSKNRISKYTVDAIPVHMFNGAWGLISVGLFASPARLQTAFNRSEHVGFFYSFNHNGADATLLAANIVGMLFIVGWVMCIMLPFFVWLDWRGWFRSDPLEEIVGLDTSYHGGLMLGGGEDQINPENVSAFNKRREENVRRRSMTNPNISNTVLEEFDHDDHYDDGNHYENSKDFSHSYDAEIQHHNGHSDDRMVPTDKEEDTPSEKDENVSIEL